jgi:restriction system protein
MVRAGKHGGREAIALEQNIVVIGWDELPDLGPYQSRESIAQLLKKTYPDVSPKTMHQWIGQVWRFRAEIKKDDLVALPLKTRSAVAFGRVTGGYKYERDNPSDARHSMPVDWLRTDVPRSAISPDILNSLGSTLTVCRIERNDAESRIRAFLKDKSGTASAQAEEASAITDEGDGAIDVQQIASDQIRTIIGQKYRGHGFADLVARILEAQGYKTSVAEEGADGGVDIVAGRGPMGFDSPRLVVQVKATNDPIDVKPLRELQGVMGSHGADQALLVSWGGFKSSIEKQERPLFFKVRLWHADDVVDALLSVYEKLPEDVQAELPLKRIWALVPEE